MSAQIKSLLDGPPNAERFLDDETIASIVPAHLLAAADAAVAAANEARAKEAEALDAVFRCYRNFQEEQSAKSGWPADARASHAAKYVFASADVEAILHDLPAGQVPTNLRTPEVVMSGTPPTATAHQNADEEVRIAMGISKEAWAKGGIPCRADRPVNLPVVVA